MNAILQQRPWRRALGLAALTLWVPALVPYWIGPLTESSHSIEAYTLLLPLVPGVIVPTVMRLDGVAWGAVGVLATLLMLGGLTLVLRRLSYPGSSIVQTITILLVSVEAFGFSMLLRA